MKLLKDKYKLIEKIDEDEKVMVFLGQTVREPLMNVDVRSLKKRWLQNPEFVQRYTQEFQTMAVLDSPLFMKIYDIDFFNNVFFVASEHIEGKTVYTLLNEKAKLSLAQIINIVTQVGRALGHAFKENVKYRALTYSDILLTEAGKVKIMQFHVPRNITANPDSENKAQSMSSDIFFVGSLFYELLTYESVYNGAGISIKHIKALKDFRLDPKNPASIKPVQTEKIKEIIYKCITTEISVRFQTIDELLNALVKFVQDQVNKTDVLTSMQVDPANFKKKTAEKNADIKIPSILPGTLGKVPADAPAASVASSAALTVESEKNVKKPGIAPMAKFHDDPYAILFGKAPIKKEPLQPLRAASEHEGDTPAENEETVPEPAGVADSVPETDVLKNGDEEITMWKNKKTSSNKGILAKIANFWYTMMFVLVGFLSFVLYVFW